MDMLSTSVRPPTPCTAHQQAVQHYYGENVGQAVEHCGSQSGIHGHCPILWEGHEQVVEQYDVQNDRQAVEHYLRMADSRFGKTWLEISTVLLATKKSMQSTVPWSKAVTRTLRCNHKC